MALALTFVKRGGDNACRPTLEEFPVLINGIVGLVALTDPENRRKARRSRTTGYVELSEPYPSGDIPSETRLLRIHMASPLDVVVELPKLAAAVPSLAVLIYVVKRLFALDLELRTHRALKRVEFERARALAEEARGVTQLSTDAATVMADAVQFELCPENRGLKTSGWELEQGTLIDSEEAENLDQASK